MRPLPSKRRRLNPGLHPTFHHDPYASIELQKDRIMYFEERDEENVLTPDWVEWNPVIRRSLGRIPRLLGRRLIYLSRFHQETQIYHTFEDIVLVEHLQDQMYGAYLRECRLKRAMRNLWGRWQTWRMDRRDRGDDVDPITLEAPVKPVTIYSWANGRRYTFDAKSISLHIEAQLTHHSGGFPVPKAPRNPWINTEFPMREITSLYLQLKKWGEVRWALQTFHAAQFDLKHWARDQRALLVRRSLEDAVRNLPHLPFLRQSVLEFIIHTLEGESIDEEKWKTIYQYALEHYPEHPVLQQWYRWYVDAHVPNQEVIIELKWIWKRQHQLARIILRDTARSMLART